jgi:NitT/TauT family transport system substrate-binding protein
MVKRLVSRREFIKLGGVGFAGAALWGVAGCGSSGESGDTGGKKVVLQGFPDLAAIPILVMQEKGIDKKHGFEAEFEETDPDAATSSFLLGETDLAIDQDPVSMTLAREQGHEAVVFYPILNMLTGMVVAEGSAYQSPRDLIGKKVGHFGIDSGTTQTMAVMIQELYGFDILEEYDLQEAGPGALPVLLQQGQVDAIMDFQPHTTTAIVQVPGRYVFEPTKAWREHTGGWSPGLAYLAARVQWLEENQGLAVAVRDAWEEATKVVIDSDYQILNKEPYASFLQMRDKKELQALVDYCVDLPCYQTNWTRQDIQNVDEYLRLMAKEGTIVKELAEEPVAVILEDFLNGSN